MVKLCFAIENIVQFGENKQVVQILINEKNIIKRLKNYELTFAKEENNPSLAGSYQGLSPQILLNNLSNTQNGKKVILDCVCGAEDCWALAVEVEKNNAQVIWKSFYQTRRSWWDYSNFGNFVFEIENYEQELQKLEQINS